MARLPRLFLPDRAQHVIQRGNRSRPPGLHQHDRLKRVQAHAAQCAADLGRWRRGKSLPDPRD